MASQPDKKYYDASYLIKYHQGKLSPKEMNALEKAALEDPFLADALEGYLYQKDENALPQDFMPKHFSGTNSIKIIPFNKRRFFYYTAAASVISLLFLGFFLFNQQFEKSETVAQKNEKNSTVVDITPPNNTDNSLSDKETSNEKEAPLLPSKETQTDDNKQIRKSQENAVEQNSKYLMNLDERELVSTPVQEDKIEMPPAPITEKKMDESPVVQADAKDKQEVKVDVASTNSNLSDQSNTSTEEVVTVGYSSKKRKEASAALNKISAKEISESNIQPKIGSVAFQQYIDQNKKPCINDLGEASHGSVTLNFIIDDKGRPVKIKASSMLKKSCESEAIRLLREGPDWQPVSSKKATTTILF